MEFLLKRRFEIERNQSKRKVKAGTEKEDFFKMLHIELLSLSKAYKLPIQRVQEMFMDCSCDLKDLKKVLRNEKDAHKF